MKIHGIEQIISHGQRLWRTPLTSDHRRLYLNSWMHRICLRKIKTVNKTIIDYFKHAEVKIPE